MSRKKSTRVSKTSKKIRPKKKVINEPKIHSPLLKTHKTNVQYVEAAPDLNDSASSNVTLNNPSKRSRRKAIIPNGSFVQCKKCYLEFSSQLNLRRHEDHFTGSRFVCTECSTRFAKKKQLNLHIRETHRDLQLTARFTKCFFRCHVCNQPFMHAAHLQAHLYHYHDNSLQLAEKQSSPNNESEQKLKNQLFNEETGIQEDQENSETFEFVENLRVAERVEENLEDEAILIKIDEFIANFDDEKRVIGFRSKPMFQNRLDDANTKRSRNNRTGISWGKMGRNDMEIEEEDCEQSKNHDEENTKRYSLGEDEAISLSSPSVTENNKKRRISSRISRINNGGIKKNGATHETFIINDQVENNVRSNVEATDSDKADKKNDHFWQSNDEEENRVIEDPATTRERSRRSAKNLMSNSSDISTVHEQKGIDGMKNGGLLNSGRTESVGTAKSLRRLERIQKNSLTNESGEMSENLKESSGAAVSEIIDSSSTCMAEDTDETKSSIRVFKNREALDRVENNLILNDTSFRLSNENMELEQPPEFTKDCEEVEKIDSCLVTGDYSENNVSNDAFQPQNVPDGTLVEISKKCTKDNKTNAKRPTRKHPRGKSANGQRKKRQKIKKNAATKLNSVLAEVAAMFSGVDVNFPTDNQERIKVAKIIHDPEESSLGDDSKNDYTTFASESITYETPQRFEDNLRAKVRDKTPDNSSYGSKSDIEDVKFLSIQDPRLKMINVSDKKELPPITIDSGSQNDQGSLPHDKVVDTLIAYSSNDEKPMETQKNLENVDEFDEFDDLSRTCQTSSDALGKFQENDGSSGVSQNSKQTENPNNTIVINDTKLKIADKTPEDTESSANMKKPEEISKTDNAPYAPDDRETDNTDKTLAINYTKTKIPEKIQANNKSSSIYDTINSVMRQINEMDRSTSNAENSEEMHTDYSLVFDDEISDEFGKIQGNNKSPENCLSNKAVGNIDETLFIHNMRIGVPDKMEGNNKSYAGFQNPKKTKKTNSASNIDETIDSVLEKINNGDPTFSLNNEMAATSEKMLEKDETPENWPGYTKIANSDKTMVITDNNIDILEKTNEGNKWSEIFWNYRKADVSEETWEEAHDPPCEMFPRFEKMDANNAVVMNNKTLDALRKKLKNVELLENSVEPKNFGPDSLINGFKGYGKNPDNVKFLNYSDQRKKHVNKKSQSSDRFSKTLQSPGEPQTLKSQAIINASLRFSKERKNAKIPPRKRGRSKEIKNSDKSSILPKKRKNPNTWPTEPSSQKIIEKTDKFTVTDNNQKKNSRKKIIGKIIQSANRSLQSMANFSKLMDDVDKKLVKNKEPTSERKITEFEHDNMLRARYSCKNCYVSITRIDPNKEFRKIHKTERRNLVNSASQSTPTLPSYSCRNRAASSASKTLRNSRISHSRKVVESIICDKRTLTKIAMARHYRRYHSIGCDDDKTCACGRSMHGQKALEEHFFKYAFPTCTGAPSLDAPSIDAPCQPTNKTHACLNCSEDFWLKTCLDLHSQDCSKSIVEAENNVPLRRSLRRKCRRGPINADNRTCRICCIKFPTYSTLVKHERTYFKPMKYGCPICGTRFGGQQLLSKHILEAHSVNIDADYSYYCMVCKQGFRQKIQHRIHMVHIHGKKYPTAVKKGPLIYNRSLSVEDDTDDFYGGKCEICGLVFVNRKDFIEHAIYYKTDEIIRCKICDLRFMGQYKAHGHNKAHHYSAGMRNAYTHHCKMCQEGFMFERHLRSHVAHVHDKIIGVISLTAPKQSGNGGNSAQARSESNEIASVPQPAEVHRCDVCQIAFPNTDLLAAHEIEFQNDGEFVCSRCGKKCRTATLLLDHLSLNHSSTIHDSVKCHRCHENLITPAAWLSHVKHYHTSDSNEPSEFYAETNITSAKVFGMAGCNFIPMNDHISSGGIYERLGNTIDSHSRNVVVENTREAAGETSVGFANVSEGRNIVDPTNEDEVKSEVEILEEPEVRIIEESPKTTVAKKNLGYPEVNVNKMWTCRICDVDCVGPLDLVNHFANYADEGPHLCDICARRFTSATLYEEHTAKHFRRNAGSMFFCAVCNEDFRTMSLMRMHNTHFHEKKIANRMVKKLLSLRYPTIGSPASSFCSSSFPAFVQASDNRTSSTAPNTSATCTKKLLDPEENSRTKFVKEPMKYPQTGKPHKPDKFSAEPVSMIPQNFKKPDVTTIASSVPALTTYEEEANPLARPAGTIVAKTPLFLYQCPDCLRNFFTFVNLREHRVFAHKWASNGYVNVNARKTRRVTAMSRKVSNTATTKTVNINRVKDRSEINRTVKVKKDSLADRPRIANSAELRSGSNMLVVERSGNPTSMSLNDSTKNITRDTSSKSPNKLQIRKTSTGRESCFSQVATKLARDKIITTPSKTEFKIIRKASTGKNAASFSVTKLSTEAVIIPLNGEVPIAQSLAPVKVQVAQKVKKKMTHRTSKEVATSSKNESPALSRCDRCDFIFPTAEMLKLHEARIHGSSVPNIIKFFHTDDSRGEKARPSARCYSVNRNLQSLNTVAPVNESMNGRNIETTGPTKYPVQALTTRIASTKFVKTFGSGTSRSLTQVNKPRNPVINSNEEGTSLKITQVYSLANLEHDFRDDETTGDRKKDHSINDRETGQKNRGKVFSERIDDRSIRQKRSFNSASQPREGGLPLVTLT